MTPKAFGSHSRVVRVNWNMVPREHSLVDPRVGEVNWRNQAITLIDPRSRPCGQGRRAKATRDVSDSPVAVARGPKPFASPKASTNYPPSNQYLSAPRPS
jgi:hypothetical protein